MKHVLYSDFLGDLTFICPPCILKFRSIANICMNQDFHFLFGSRVQKYNCSHGQHSLGTCVLCPSSPCSVLLFSQAIPFSPSCLKKNDPNVSEQLLPLRLYLYIVCIVVLIQSVYIKRYISKLQNIQIYFKLYF